VGNGAIGGGASGLSGGFEGWRVGLRGWRLGKLRVCGAGHALSATEQVRSPLAAPPRLTCCSLMGVPLGDSLTDTMASALDTCVRIGRALGVHCSRL